MGKLDIFVVAGAMANTFLFAEGGNRPVALRAQHG
jgi:3-phosphoglycerate kinase